MFVSLHAGSGVLTLLAGGALLGGGVLQPAFVSGHGHLLSPRSRNFFAYEAGRDDIGSSPAGLPPREYCSHCLNMKAATDTCGVGSAQSYDAGSGWKDAHQDAMPWISQASYVEGQEILVEIELTTNHAGHAEVRACPLPDEGDAVATQECFDAHPLTFVRDVCYGGPADELYPVRGYFSNHVMHHFIYALPDGVSAERVLLQWRYITANSCIPPGYKDEARLGLDALGWLRGFSMADCNVDQQDPPELVLDPTGSRGPGDPEQFWNCAEVTIAPLATDGSNDPGPHTASSDICPSVSNPPPSPPSMPPPTTPTTWAPNAPPSGGPPSPPIGGPVDPTEGYCNWGPLGTGLSSTCDGCVQGGSVCNEGVHKCESDCGGRWCTNVEAIDSTCSNEPSPNPPPPPPPPMATTNYCGTSWTDAKESTCLPLNLGSGGGLADTAIPCADGNSTICRDLNRGYCYADVVCDFEGPSPPPPMPTPPTTGPPPAPTPPTTGPPPAPTPPTGGGMTASTTRYWDCSGGACGCAYLPGGPGTDDNPAHCHSNAMFAAPPGNEYGAAFYGAAAISRFLWDGNTNSGDWMGEGCGKCFKVTGSSNANTGSSVGTSTTLVLKGTNICPTGICNENGKAHFDIAAPGFDVLEYSWSNTCKDLEADELEGFESCGRWMIDNQDPLLNCDCSKFNSPTLRAGCENFYSLGWDNAAVTYEEVECPQEIATLPCWAENGYGYPQTGIPETCMDPNGDPNVMLPFPDGSGGGPSPTPPTPTVNPPPPTSNPPPTGTPPTSNPPPPTPTTFPPIECPAGYETARWTWYISYPKCCADQPHYDPLASTEECEVYNGCSWDGDFAYVGNRPFEYVQSTDIVAFFASNGETYPKKIIRVYSPGHDKTVDAIVLDTCGDADCNGCCTENADTGGGYLVDMEENTVVRHFGALNEANGLVCWQIVDDAEYDGGGYCSWNGCNGVAQGDWDCNLNEYECENTCAGSWCPTTPPAPPVTLAPVTDSPVAPPTTETPVKSPTVPPAPTNDPVTSSPVAPPTTEAPVKSPTVPPAPTNDPVTSSPVALPTTEAPIKSPTKLPTSSPTTEPPAPTSGGNPCCTWDLKTCSLDSWCNASETNCRTGCSAPYWFDVSACPANGVAKGYDCTGPDKDCCPGLVCVEHSQWYHSCEDVGS